MSTPPSAPVPTVAEVPGGPPQTPLSQTPPPSNGVPIPPSNSSSAPVSAASNVTPPSGAATAPVTTSTPTSPSVPARVISRNEESFRQIFDRPEDKLVDDFSCALQLKSLLLHGRLYISDKNICFFANILGRKTTKIIPYHKIVAVYKKTTAIVFTNAMEIVTRKTKYFLSSFMFREAAYKVLTQAWAEAIPESVGRVIMKSEGAELFLKPLLPGETPYPGTQEDDSESESERDLSLLSVSSTPSPVKTSASSPSLPTSPPSGSPLNARRSSAERPAKRVLDFAAAAGTSDEAKPPSGTDPSIDKEIQDDTGLRKSSSQSSDPAGPAAAKKSRRASQPVEPAALSVQKQVPEAVTIKKKKTKSVGSSRSKNSLSSRRDPAATVEAAAQILAQQLLDQQQQQNSPSDDEGWLLEDKLVDDDIATKLPRSTRHKSTSSRPSRAESAPIRVSAPVNLMAALKSAQEQNSPQVANTQNVQEVAPAPISSSSGQPSILPELQTELAPAPPPTLMTQFDEKQIDNFLVVKPPIRDTPCSHVLEGSADPGTTSTLLEKELPGLTVLQFYLLFWHNPQWWQDWAKALEWTEWTWSDWHPTTPDNCCLVRTNNFRMPLRQALGPKSTRVDSEIHLKFKNKYHMVAESSAVSKDVPFGESFTAHEKWSVIQSGQNLKIHVGLSIRWKKAAWGFKSTIEKKTFEATKAQVESWFQLAQPIIEEYLNNKTQYEEQEREGVKLPPAIKTLTAEVESAIHQISASDSDSEADDIAQEKKEEEAVFRHIRRNSSITSDAAFLGMLQPSAAPAASGLGAPQPIFPGRHSRQPSEVSRAIPADISHANLIPASSSLEPSTQTILNSPISAQATGDEGSPFAAISQFANQLSANYMWMLLLVCFVSALAVSFGIWALMFMFFGPNIVSSPSNSRNEFHIPNAGLDASFSRHAAVEPGLADYVLFLEHTVSSLLKNITNPGSFMKEQQRYWKASQELERQLVTLASFTSNMLASVKANRLAHEELDALAQSEHEDLYSSHIHVDEKLRQFFQSRAAAFRDALHRDPSKEDAVLSQKIRSSPWYIYILYVLGSLLVASVIAGVVLKFAGVSIPRIPFISDLIG